ncbi:hypothetical protein NIES4074_48470 [Cylindrospermum sp. NIES-4074]|nr:hypothetical protein NIES4074_48470 [Cylindrospermum sp. NIES-4074]
MLSIIRLLAKIWVRKFLISQSRTRMCWASWGMAAYLRAKVDKGCADRDEPQSERSK